MTDMKRKNPYPYNHFPKYKLLFFSFNILYSTFQVFYTGPETKQGVNQTQ